MHSVHVWLHDHKSTIFDDLRERGGIIFFKVCHLWWLTEKQILVKNQLWLTREIIFFITLLKTKCVIFDDLYDWLNEDPFMACATLQWIAFCMQHNTFIYFVIDSTPWYFDIVIIHNVKLYWLEALYVYGSYSCSVSFHSWYSNISHVSILLPNNHGRFFPDLSSIMNDLSRFPAFSKHRKNKS